MTKEDLLREIQSLRISCNAFYQSMIDRIRELESENAELKAELKDANKKVVHLACNQNKDLKRKINKAIEILKKYHIECPSKYSFEDIDDMAEQFLSEVENEKH